MISSGLNPYRCVSSNSRYNTPTPTTTPSLGSVCVLLYQQHNGHEYLKHVNHHVTLQDQFVYLCTSKVSELSTCNTSTAMPLLRIFDMIVRDSTGTPSPFKFSRSENDTHPIVESDTVDATVDATVSKRSVGHTDYTDYTCDQCPNET